MVSFGLMSDHVLEQIVAAMIRLEPIASDDQTVGFTRELVAKREQDEPSDSSED